MQRFINISDLLLVFLLALGSVLIKNTEAEIKDIKISSMSEDKRQEQAKGMKYKVESISNSMKKADNATSLNKTILQAEIEKFNAYWKLNKVEKHLYSQESLRNLKKRYIAIIHRYNKIKD